jgi:hypothetical protein
MPHYSFFAHVFASLEYMLSPQKVFLDAPNEIALALLPLFAKIW